MGLAGMDDIDDWQSRFSKATDELAKLELRVLIVVDDVDRLQSDELASLLKAVRLLGRFPGVHYLLAFDPVTVRRVLSQTDVVGTADPSAADAFLEKIVQVALPVPPVQPVQLRAAFEAEARQLFGDFGLLLDSDDLRRLDFTYNRLFSDSLSTLRAVRRFFWQLRAYLPLVDPHEVNIVDFMVLTHLNQHFPAIYDEVWRRREELTGTIAGRYLAMLTPGSDDQPSPWQQVMVDAQVPSHLRDSLLDVLASVFPAMPGADAPGIAAAGSMARCPARDPRYFPRYFALTMPVGDVPDALVNRCLDRLASGDLVGWSSVAEYLSLDSSQEVRVVTLEKLESLSRARDDLDHTRLIAAATAMLAELPSDGNDPLGRDSSGAVERWMAGEISSCRSSVAAAGLLTELLPLLADDLSPLMRALNDAVSPHAAAKSLRSDLWEALAEEAGNRVLAAIKTGAGASEEPLLAYIDFCVRSRKRESFVAEVDAVRTEAQVPMEEVAALFINDTWNPKTGGWQLGHLERGLIEQVIDPDVLRNHPRYAAKEVDLVDRSWRNRVAAAELALSQTYPLSELSGLVEGE